MYYLSQYNKLYELKQNVLYKTTECITWDNVVYHVVYEVIECIVCENIRHFVEQDDTLRALGVSFYLQVIICSSYVKSSLIFSRYFS